MKKIDVVMSVYNVSKYISETLTSILNQTHNNIKVIIVDDGSTDDTMSIIEEFQSKDNRVEYYYQENAGIVSAVNRGLNLCTSEYIARHDGDDISYLDRFEKELAYLIKNPDCVAVSALARHIDESGNPIGTQTRTKDMSLVDDSSIPANEPYILQPLVMMRRDALCLAGGYRQLTVAEDTDLYWRMMKIGGLHILPYVLGDYRIHSESISSRSILSGRKISVWTQLSALSAQRIRKNLPDISFDIDLKDRLNSANELIELFEIVKPLLRFDEQGWFFSAMAAKLIESCYYRPFEPLESDIKYIRAVYKIDVKVRSRRLYKVYEEGLLSASIRLAIEGRVADSIKLVPPYKWPKLFARTLFRKYLPKNFRGKIKSNLLRR